MTLSSTEEEYDALSACAQEVKFVSMLLEEMTEVQKSSVIYEDNQGVIFLVRNRQVCISTKHINICHRFLGYLVKDKDIGFQYIRGEDNPADIMIKNTLETDYFRHINSALCTSKKLVIVLIKYQSEKSEL